MEERNDIIGVDFEKVSSLGFESETSGVHGYFFVVLLGPCISLPSRASHYKINGI
jgi:hypothetical protein